MSFFMEDDNKVITLFFTGGAPPSVFQKKISAEMGGTFYARLKSERGFYPAWIFDRSKRLQVEEFLEDADDADSVNSYPDIDAVLTELCRRVERAEMDIRTLKKQNTFKS